MLRGMCMWCGVVCASILCLPGIGAAEIIGQLSDPEHPAIDPYTDIVASWIEKDRASLTFVIELRGNVPDPSQLPEYDDSITYLWLVDADNCPYTEQAPGNLIGNEFNLRVVISQDPGQAGGFVDVVGGLAGGGHAMVEVVGNQVYLTIDTGQIDSPRRFTWRCDTFKNFNGYPEGHNGVTGESGLARVTRYGIVVLNDNTYYGYGDNILSAYLQSDPGNPVIDRFASLQDSYPKYNVLSDAYPDTDNVQISLMALSQATNRQVHTASHFLVESPGDGISGDIEATAMQDIRFILDGQEGETGPVPSGAFIMTYDHDYTLSASDTSNHVQAWTYSQVVITQLDPLTQKGLWLHQKAVGNGVMTNRQSQTVDLADVGLELGVEYSLNVLLIDRIILSAPSTDVDAITGCTVRVRLDDAHMPCDLNGDGIVDLEDYAIFTGYWLHEW